MSWPFIVLLALGLALVVGAEWPRIKQRTGPDARRSRERTRRKAGLRLIRNERSESDEFAESVQRDLQRLPTIEEKDRT